MFTRPPSIHAIAKFAVLVFALVIAIDQTRVLLAPTPAAGQFGLSLAGFFFENTGDAVRETRREIREKIKTALTTSANIAFKNSLRVFAGKLAEDTAEWVGSWGTGQRPLFLTDKKYFSNLFDAAAGEALDTYAVSVFGQSVCQPLNLETQLTIVGAIENLTLDNPIQACQNRCQRASDDRRTRIRRIESDLAQAATAAEADPTLVIQCNVNEPPGGATADADYEWGSPGVMLAAGDCRTKLEAVILKERARDTNALRLCLRDCQTGRKKASCGLQTALKNLEDSRVAAEVNLALRIEENDLGQILKLYGETREKQERAVAEERAQLELGFTPQTTRVTGEVTIPRELVQKRAEIALEESTIAERTYTGTLVADVINTFTNTVISRWTERIFKGKCGLNPAACAGPGQGRSAGGSDFLSGLTGIAAAQLQFQSLGQISYIRGDASRSLEIFSIIRSRGVHVDDRLVQAVREQRTVSEALEAGLLDGSRTFGFDAEGNEPKDGYPYRLLLYLRHYRIIPVGWELAAQYNRQFDPSNRSLQDLVDDFDMCGQDAEHPYSPYCGLVDPNWVLKAPTYFCKRQGAGEEIITRQFICDADTNGNGEIDCSPTGSGSGIVPDIGRWEIARNADYCADEQSCVVERDDGSCAQFGYCFAEKRVWKFDGTSCPNYYASCTAFQDQDGIEVAYLTNTVDHNSCSSENAGCGWYCMTTFNGEWTCDGAGAGLQRYFDRDAESCPASAEGCTEYLQTAGGANLAGNSSFEEYTGTPNDGVADVVDGWTSSGPIEVIDSDNGFVGTDNTVGVKLAAGSDLTMDPPHLFASSPGPSPDELLYYRRFTLSYYARTLVGSCSGDATVDVGLGAARSTASMSYTSNWSRYVVTSDAILPPTAIPLAAVQVTIGGPGCDLLVDNVQLEEGPGPSSYKDYGRSHQVYLNENAARCDADQVGCERYTPADGGLDVAGIVTDADRCTAENVGCSAFKEMPITNVPTRAGRDPLYFVPDTGSACTASSVGCEEYTNLEAQARGGEAREYFSFIKQCVLPSDTNPNQVTFFSWEGSDSRGYELKSFRMLKSNIDAGPCTNLTVGSTSSEPVCNDTATTQASCAASDVGSDPNCTEYFNVSGEVFYRLRSRIISATESCFPARNTIDQENGIDVIYNISPDESVRCPAAHNRCREYRGNTGNNIREAFRDDFEDGQADGWDGAGISNESASGTGFSLRLGPGGRINETVIPNAVSQGQAYTLTFWAKPQTAGTTLSSVYFDGAPSLHFLGSPLAMSDGWQLYTIGPVLIDRALDTAEGITFNPSGTIFLDNLTLREVTDSQYRIADTWRSCAASEVGCAVYTDRGNHQEFLKSFTRLCPDDKVGCQQLIDTQNSSIAGAQTVKGVVVPADDRSKAWVVDPNYFCEPQYKGCRAFGKPIIASDGSVTEFSTQFLIDDPDRHGRILCTAEEDRCSEYTSTLDGSVTHFRDPGQRVCVYKRLPGSSEFTWVYEDTNQPCSSTEPYDTCVERDTDGDGVLDAYCYASQTDAECLADGCAVRRCESQYSVCNEYRDTNDPPNCRAQCPLTLRQGQPDPVDENCQPLEASLGGIPGCRSYYYLKQSVEGSAAECGTNVDLEAGCRPFFDTSNPSRTFRSF